MRNAVTQSISLSVNIGLTTNLIVIWESKKQKQKNDSILPYEILTA